MYQSLRGPVRDICPNRHEGFICCFEEFSYDPFGVRALSCNALEWTATFIEGQKDSVLIVGGGSFLPEFADPCASLTQSTEAWLWNDNVPIGFRCVKNIN